MQLQYGNKMEWLCKIFGHKWPDFGVMHVLLTMAAIEIKNNFPCKTEIKCKRCGFVRNLNNELRDRMVKITLPENK